MSDFAKHVGMTKRLKDVTDRVEAMEKAVNNLFSLLNKELGQTKDTLEGVVEVSNALIELTGVDEVQANLNAKADAKLAAEEAAVKGRLDAGQLKESDTVSPVSIVAYKETDAAGNVRHPGKFYRAMSTLAPESSGLLVGKKVGEDVNGQNGGKFTILSVYEMVAAKPSTVPTETLAQAAAAAEPPPPVPEVPTAEATV